MNVSRKFGNASILLDSAGLGDPILEDIQRINEGSYITDEGFIDIQGFKFTNISKNQLISNLQVAFETDKISFPNIPILIDELEAFEYQILETTGSFKYGSPIHDDTVIGLALANWAVDHQKHYEVNYSRVIEDFTIRG